MLVGVPANRNLILNTVSEAPYRVTAEMIRSTCGQTVSHGGVWNLIQQLGGRISEEEKVTISEMNAGQAKGTAVIPVLFEGMDGVWLRMQGKDHKRMKKQEMKVSVMYEGWEKDRKKTERRTAVSAIKRFLPEWKAVKSSMKKEKPRSIGTTMQMNSGSAF